MAYFDQIIGINMCDFNENAIKKRSLDLELCNIP